MAEITLDTFRRLVPSLRSKWGAVGGPEFLGCFNTGRRPVLRRITCGKDLWIVVGPQNPAEEITATAAGRAALIEGKRVHGKGKDRVWIYRTRGPAVARFAALCMDVHQWNAAQRAKLDAARQDRLSQDPERRMRGALAMMDH